MCTCVYTSAEAETGAHLFCYHMITYGENETKRERYIPLLDAAELCLAPVVLKAEHPLCLLPVVQLNAHKILGCSD